MVELLRTPVQTIRDIPRRCRGLLALSLLWTLRGLDSSPDSWRRLLAWPKLLLFPYRGSPERCFQRRVALWRAADFQALWAQALSTVREPGQTDAARFPIVEDDMLPPGLRWE